MSKQTAHAFLKWGPGPLPHTHMPHPTFNEDQGCNPTPTLSSSHHVCRHVHKYLHAQVEIHANTQISVKCRDGLQVRNPHMSLFKLIAFHVRVQCTVHVFCSHASALSTPGAPYACLFTALSAQAFTSSSFMPASSFLSAIAPKPLSASSNSHRTHLQS